MVFMTAILQKFKKNIRHFLKQIFQSFVALSQQYGLAMLLKRSLTGYIRSNQKLAFVAHGLENFSATLFPFLVIACFFLLFLLS